MNRKAIPASAMCLLGLSAYAQKTDRPNVIIIYTDDQGTLDAGCYGASDLYTPNIDSLAKDGVRFSQFYGAPVSSASRASLMTGQYTRHAGLADNAGYTGLPLGKETIAERMHDSGYQTACIGKWHLGSLPEYAPNSRGFDYFWGFLGGCIDSYSHFFYWDGPNKHDLWENRREIYRPGRFFAGETLDRVRDFISDTDKDKPFFLYWAVNIPHYPLQPKEKWLEYYHDLPSPRRMYAAFLSTFDEYLGELRTFLRASGLEEDTIIIFQSDNGHSTEIRTFGSGGYCGDYRGAKFSLFEGGIRVPAIISWKGHFPENETRDGMAMNVDWFPTLVELCQLKTKGMDVDGKSLVPMIMDRVRDFISDTDKDKPFFLYWAVNIPHYPLQPKEKWLEYYHDLPSPRRMYAAFLSTFDEYLGELRTFLRASGLEEDTIIIFQSDNGHSTEIRTFGSGGYCGDYRGAKFSLFEGGIRVPAIISWKGHFPENETRDGMAMNVDWFPTLVELCQLKTKGMDVDGKSLVPMIMDGATPSPHEVLHFDYGKQWAVRYGDWKLLNNVIDVHPNDKNKTIDGLYLTNLMMDSTEKTDYSKDYPEVVEKLLKIRHEYEASTPVASHQGRN